MSYKWVLLIHEILSYISGISSTAYKLERLERTVHPLFSPHAYSFLYTENTRCISKVPQSGKTTILNDLNSNSERKKPQNIIRCLLIIIKVFYCFVSKKTLPLTHISPSICSEHQLGCHQAHQNLYPLRVCTLHAILSSLYGLNIFYQQLAVTLCYIKPLARLVIL